MAKIIGQQRRTNAAGLSTWWTFADGTARNFAGDPDFDGSAVGTPSLTNGFATRVSPIGSNGFLLNGSTDWFRNTTHKISAAATYTIRIKATNFTPAYSGIVGFGRDVSNFQMLFVKSTGKLAAYQASNDPASSVNYDGSGANTLVSGRPYHLALSYGPTLGLVAYVNGIRDNSAAYGNTNYKGGAAVTFAVGNDPIFASRLFAGIVGDARYYCRELMPDEIFAIAQEPYVSAVSMQSQATLNVAAGFLAAWGKNSNLPIIGAGTN